MANKVSVLFVCMGNICRSPTAEGFFRQQVEQEDLNFSIGIDSAGTIGYHAGNPPDTRAISAAQRHGVDIRKLRARQVNKRDLQDFDYVIAMDRDNLNHLQSLSDHSTTAELSLLLSFADAGIDEVPDPYYGGEAGFEEVIRLVQDACAGLLEHIQSAQANT